MPQSARPIEPLHHPESRKRFISQNISSRFWQHTFLPWGSGPILFKTDSRRFEFNALREKATATETVTAGKEE